MSDDPREKLLGIYPHLLLAVGMAKIQEPDGEIQLAIISKKPDGTGRITASFRGEEFLEDLGKLLDWENELKKEVETPFLEKELTGFQLIKKPE